MDLSLRGSQINLATRDKPKPTAVKYPPLLSRPCSANVTRLVSRSSNSLRQRPMSADDKLARSLKNCVRFSEQVMNEEQLWKNRKFMSTSSSNIFKLLLEEPINRSYCPPDSESMSDSCSSLGQKISEAAATKQTKVSESSESDSNVETRILNKNRDLETSEGTDKKEERMKARPLRKQMLNNGSSYISKSKFSSLPRKLQETSTGSDNFWRDSKPDLPGRVSFAKSKVSVAVEYPDQDIDLNESKNNLSSSTKKYVHFQETSAGVDPSPCSSTLELNRPECHDTGDKCYCPLTCNSSGYLTFSENESVTPDPNETKSMKATNSLIEQYKDEIENEEKKIQLELKMMDKNSTSSSIESSTDRLISDYKDLANQIFDDIQADFISSQDKVDGKLSSDTEQNNLSAISKHPNNSLDNSSDSTDSSKQFENLRNFQETSSAVIKNYLNTTTNDIQTLSSLTSGSKNQRRPKDSNLIANKTDTKGRIRRTKSANPTISVNRKTNPDGIKKAPTYSCLRQDSDLGEFQIDKVDSWMSLYDSGDVYRPAEREYHGKSSNQRRQLKDETKSILRHKDAAIESIEDDSYSQDDSTYDEIVSVIREIEEDKKQEITASRTEVDLTFNRSGSSADGECLATPKTVRNERDQSPDKLRDILHYLDNVENSCDKTIMETRRSIPESSRSEIEFAIEPDIAEDVPKIADLLMLPNHQLARRVVALSLRANELANAIQLSKQHVSHIRFERQKALRQEKSNSANRLTEQKKHYENIVARHQGFIEQLLKDKGSLCEKIAVLTRRIESQNQAWEHKLETELARIKETAVAGEKIRREKWIRDNTKKIKELTVKGLELEINRMSCEHQKEITELKRKHQQELLDSVAEERQKFEQLEKSIRETCAQDRESTIAKEREAIRERFEKQLREEQRLFDEQKSKLLEEFATERERICQEIKQKDVEFEQKRQEILKERDTTGEQVRNEFKEKLQKQEEKYLTRIHSIEKQFESDFLIWKREFENACKLREVENENAIRQHYRTERDRQIDAIVAKMDAETQRLSEEYEMKLSRLKEKYDSELQQLENAEKSLKAKFNEARNRLAESEARVQNYQAEGKQLKMELSHSKRMCDTLLEEKESTKEDARREVQQEIATIQLERDNEIEKIYQRVQQAIEKKDTAVDLLQKENGSLRERCIKLESVIRQQRKDYCIK